MFIFMIDYFFANRFTNRFFTIFTNPCFTSAW